MMPCVTKPYFCAAATPSVLKQSTVRTVDARAELALRSRRARGSTRAHDMQYGM